MISFIIRGALTSQSLMTLRGRKPALTSHNSSAAAHPFLVYIIFEPLPFPEFIGGFTADHNDVLSRYGKSDAGFWIQSTIRECLCYRG